MTQTNTILAQIAEGELIHQEFIEGRSGLPKSFFEKPLACAHVHPDGAR
jgi:hypothetical protein